MESKDKTGVLLMTGYAGLKGTQELLAERRQELQNRFSDAFLRKTGQICKKYSGKDILIPESAGAIFKCGVHGIYADLWDFAEKLCLGLKADIRKIPIRQETIEIANFLDINPYEISSEGSELLYVEYNRLPAISETLLQKGIDADEIGSFDHGNDRVLLNKGARRFLTPLSRIEDEKRLRNSQKQEKEQV